MTTYEKICTLGLWNSSVPGISFDENGVSNFARIQQKLMHDFPRGEEGKKQWIQIVEKLKKLKGKSLYHCVVGVSGGTDSSYLLYVLKQYGLNPLAVNLDNGWNGEIAVQNIKKITASLGIDLETYVIEYDEIADVLRTYLRASLPWADYPSDQAIHSVLYKIAKRENIKYIMLGADFRSEGKQPSEWTYSDTRQLKYLHRKFGQTPLKTYPMLSFAQQFFYNFVLGIKVILPYYYLDYKKNEAQKLLIEKFNWQYYGEHHHENLFTKWVISYWMYEKFGIDKRIITYSAQILSGEISREQALQFISEKPYKENKIESDIEFVKKKLRISDSEYNQIWNAPNKSFSDYPSDYFLIKKTIRFFAPVIKTVFGYKPKLAYEFESREK